MTSDLSHEKGEGIDGRRTVLVRERNNQVAIGVGTETGPARLGFSAVARCGYRAEPCGLLGVLIRQRPGDDHAGNLQG